MQSVGLKKNPLEFVQRIGEKNKELYAIDANYGL